METLCVGKYGKEHNNSITRLRYSANHTLRYSAITMHLIACQSEHTSLFRTMSFVKITRFGKAVQRGEKINVRNVENNVFLNLKPRKHIALHQIHKIMLFLESPYDPFKFTALLLIYSYKISQIPWYSMLHSKFHFNEWIILPCFTHRWNHIVLLQHIFEDDNESYQNKSNWIMISIASFSKET